MDIKLSDHFDYKRLLRFSMPSVMMMLFTSIYGIVDGFFISNVEGETAFAAINLLMPYCMMFSAVGSLFGVGGSALVAFILGHGEKERANSVFSLLVYVMIAVSIVLTVIAEIFVEPVTRLFGATGEMYRYAVTYSRVFLSTVPAFLLQYAFQSFLVTAEQPKLGLLFTVGAGVTNMILDWLFIAVFRWGVAGAAAATCLGQCFGGFGPLLYFIFSKSSPLTIGRTVFSSSDLLKACSNGTADFITNVAINIVSIVYNFQLMKYIGEIGVSAYGIIMYVNMIFIGIYLGYSMGTAPLFSFNYGAGNTVELKNLFIRSMKMMVFASFVLSFMAIVFARPIAAIFAGYDENFLDTSAYALKLFSICYFFAGINIFSANLFAALNDGRTSSVLSFLRMFVFQLAAVLLLPLFWGSTGIWLSMPFAELMTFIISVVVLVKMKSRYQYA